MSEPASTIVLVLGVSALLVAFLGRELARLRRRARLVAKLSSPVLDERVEAGETLVGFGLSGAARHLLAAMEHEEEPEARMRLALTVGRRQWEPGNGRKATALRKWAQTELEGHGYTVMPFGPAFTRLSDMGGPRLDEPKPKSDGPAATEQAPDSSVSPDVAS